MDSGLEWLMLCLPWRTWRFDRDASLYFVVEQLLGVVCATIGRACLYRR